MATILSGILTSNDASYTALFSCRRWKCRSFAAVPEQRKYQELWSAWRVPDPLVRVYLCDAVLKFGGTILWSSLRIMAAHSVLLARWCVRAVRPPLM